MSGIVKAQPVDGALERADGSRVFDRLSPASVPSLSLQGGPMDERERARFATRPHLAAALAGARLPLRRRG